MDIPTFPVEGTEILLRNDKKRIKHGWRYSSSMIKKRNVIPTPDIRLAGR